MKETFLPIFGHPQYEISNLARVISHKRKTPQELKIFNYSNGYQFVKIDGQSCLIHRLVLMTFNPVEGMENLQVNHIDCNRKNNKLDNLEWVTSQQNRDYRDNVCHSTPKAIGIKVEFLTGEVMAFYTMTECADYFGLTRKAINRYLETDNIRSDRKVQAYFSIITKEEVEEIKRNSNTLTH